MSQSLSVVFLFFAVAIAEPWNQWYAELNAAAFLESVQPLVLERTTAENEAAWNYECDINDYTALRSQEVAEDNARFWKVILGRPWSSKD